MTMSFFSKQKTNGDAARLVEPSASGELLLRELNPLRLIVSGLKQRLDDAKHRLSELQKDYDAACLALAEGQEATPVKIQEAMRETMSLIAGTETLLAKKQAELAPLSAEYQRLKNAENKAQQEAEARAYVEATRLEIRAAHTNWKRSEEKYWTLLNAMRQRGFYHEAQRIAQELNQEEAVRTMKHIRI